jgi:hypothetical protein
MSNSWLLNSILGEEPTASSKVPHCPIVDVERDTRGYSPLATNPLLRSLSQEHAIKAVFGSEMLDLMRADNPSPAIEPATSTYRGHPDLRVPVPEHVSDPRKINCQCECEMCQSGSGCWNCMADPRCEFSTLHFLSELVSVDLQNEVIAQAAKRQNQRFAPVKKKKKSLVDEMLARHYSKAALTRF